MKQVENKYVLKRLTNTQDTMYHDAIKIYNDTTPPDIKTNSNEIASWVSNNESNSNFEVMTFALIVDDKIVGFSMMTYLKHKKIIMIEYLALLEAYKVNVVFFSFMNLMKSYLVGSNYDVRYFVVEISNKNNGKSVDKESQFFLKFLCLEGYGKANAIYYTPPLGIDEPESSFNAYLYVKSNDHLNMITNETYKSIVYEIYYTYFYNWYKPSINPEKHSEYKQKIDNYFSDIDRNVQKSSAIDIIYNSCPANDFDFVINTSGAIPSPMKLNKALAVPFYILLIIIIPIIVVFIYSFALRKIGIKLDEVSSMIGTIFASILSVALSVQYYARKKS